MTAEKLYALLGDVSDQHIALAANYQYKPKISKRTWLSLAATAACLCLVVSLWGQLMPTKDMGALAPGGRVDGTSAPDMAPEAAPFEPTAPAPAPDPVAPGSPEATSPPSLTVDEVFYIHSRHLSAITLTLPEGFSYLGETDQGPGYTNPDYPYWIYVKTTVMTDGTCDENNVMTPIDPQPGYVRYVTEWLRGTDLVRVGDQLYCRAAGSDYVLHLQRYGNTLSQSEYDQIQEQYGFRIEGQPAEGFTKLGDARFTGLDTIPHGELAANVEGAAVYTNPDKPHMVLVESTWHSALGEHQGFDVYLKWEVPAE